MKLPLVISLIAFGLRLLFRLIRGEHNFWTQGYQQYDQLARNIMQRSEFCLDTAFGVKCAYWPPVYPLFVTFFSNGAEWYVTLIIAKAAVGSMTCIVIFLIAEELFDRTVATIAALLVAVYPYFVFHDVTIQDTVLFGFLSALSILCIIRALRSESNWPAALAGFVLGITMLTRATLLPFVVMLVVWAAFLNRKKALTIAFVFCLVVSPWLIRNWIVLGSPVVTSQSGRFLWIAHNPWTFSRYPAGNIDDSEYVAWQNVPPEEQQRIMAMDETAQSEYFKEKGIGYIQGDPAHAVYSALIKVKTAFSWEFSPEAFGIKSWVYFLSYFPMLLLGIAGVFWTRRRWRELMPVYLMFASFIIGTAIYWAHTSHRSVLDGFIILFASTVLAQAWRRLNPNVETII